ncbi:hypothetical protein N9D09_01185 [bacterium]|nr:hypothetical protein [bacterium]
MYDTLRRKKFQGNFIEFGGGFSTIMASTFLRIPNSAITSVDFNPSKYHRILNSTQSSKGFLSRINCQPEITVSLEQVDTCLGEILQALEEFDTNRVTEALKFYGYEGDFDPYQIQTAFKQHPAFAIEEGFYEQFSAISGRRLCSSLVESEQTFEAYFFDCGEISSIAEFWLLLPMMRRGDYVLLHDIIYPKSIKNFLVATYINVCNDWEILYLDKSTPQGGLVARKISK